MKPLQNPVSSSVECSVNKVGRRLTVVEEGLFMA